MKVTISDGCICCGACESICSEVFSIEDTAVVNEDSSLEPGSIVSVDKEGINVACAHGQIKLITIQAPGKGPVKAADIARSKKDVFSVGNRFV